MKEKHIAGWITTALIIIVGVLSFPYVWFQVEANEFLEHKFVVYGDVDVEIHDYQQDRVKELSDRRSKNIALSALQRELEYSGPLFYTVPKQLRGDHEIYEVRISDYTNGGHWLVYIGDVPEYNYIASGDDFSPGFAVNTELLEIFRELFKE